MKTLVRMRRCALRACSLNRRFCTSKIIPDLWLVALFCPLKKGLPHSTLMYSIDYLFYFTILPVPILIKMPVLLAAVDTGFFQRQRRGGVLGFHCYHALLRTAENQKVKSAFLFRLVVCVFEALCTHRGPPGTVPYCTIFFYDYADSLSSGQR